MNKLILVALFSCLLVSSNAAMSRTCFINLEAKCGSEAESLNHCDTTACNHDALSMKILTCIMQCVSTK